MRTSPARPLLIGLALVVVLAVPALVDAHGGDATLIHACVQQATQQVRIVGPNDPCRSTEIAVHWSIAGGPGTQGPRGLQGPRGPSGGTIQGRLTACGPQNFLGALVYAPGTSFSAIANVDGTFAISHVLPGTYNLVVELPGHAPAMLQNSVTVTDDQIANIGDVQTTDTSGDTQNCGTCGHACSPGQSCTAGTCATAPCPSGTTSCNGTCVNTSVDAQNCGTCGFACSFAHGVGSCIAGRCTLTACMAGFGDCNNNPADGCETSLHTRQNCGFCGEACLANETCVAGVCVCTSGLCP